MIDILQMNFPARLNHVKIAVLRQSLDNRQIGAGKRGPITEKLQALFFDVVAGKAPQYQHWLTLV